MSDGGKGSSPRPFAVDQNTYQSNWEKTFGKKTPQEMDDARAEDAEFERIKREFDEKVIMKPDFSE
jgi:FAD/FMN-containing dehydrogenase